MNKQLWILAGGNGSGKSTFYKTQLKSKDIAFVNADNIAREMNPNDVSAASYEAAKLAIQQFDEYVGNGYSFCYETVFSHHSKIDKLSEAKDSGYEVVLVYIHLDKPELNQLRVQQRVSEGGHPVNSEKIASRLPRTQKHMAEAAKIADVVLLFNNSSHENPFMRVAEKRNTSIVAHVDPLPVWASNILF